VPTGKFDGTVEGVSVELGVDGVSVSTLVPVPVPADWESPFEVGVEDELLRHMLVRSLRAPKDG
jgi:hypothetical protein